MFIITIATCLTTLCSPTRYNSFIDDIQAGNYSTSSLDDLSENFAVGKQLLRDYNIGVNIPVVMVPGVISTGIES
ncbi:BAF_HP2_G0030140.mRNA.1.CDS.1 [Saccharomyces cerevisiae]|nr:BAF_HP2_G0030140.mRNA.1.CDS.1 [Saccharomyces cerevisiae]CAI6455077.1 BAF_HP2_G0030140.mRNA.1.CDS.1 [Saccharomyces cerevisiae]